MKCVRYKVIVTRKYGYENQFDGKDISLILFKAYELSRQK